MFALATAAILAMSCPPTRAADFLPASGNWNVPANWSGGAVPTGSQYAYIYAGRTALAPVGVSGTAYYLYLGYSGWGYLNISGGNLLLGYCSIAEQAGIHADLTISSGSLDLTKMVSGALWVGRSGTGTLNLSGGTVSDWQGTVGASGNGTATISGGTWNNSVLTVGLSGTGALNLNGGTVSDQYGYVGNNAGSNGSATITGGTWNTSTSLTVGVSGAGTVNLNGGTVAINSGSGSLLLASNAGSSGTLNFGSTTGTLSAAAVNGGAGTAAVNFNHATGSYTFSPGLKGTLGVYQTGAGTTILTGTNTYTGTTTISGGTLQIGNGGASGTLGTAGVVDNATLAINRSDSFTLANSITGSGSLRQDGPGLLTLTAGNSYTGGTTIKSGTLAVPGSGSINHINGNMVIGDSSGDSGVLSLIGGTVSSREGYLGRNAGSSGSATITSGTWSMDQFLYVGYLGTGTLNIAGGTVTDYVAFIDSNSTATVASGNWNHNHSLYVGQYGMGTLNLTGGSISDYNGYLGNYANAHGTATITSGSWSNSGELFVGHDISSTGTLYLDGGAVSDYHGYLGYNAGSNGSATITSGTWTHTGGFYVGWFGTGTLTLNGGTISDWNGVVGHYAGSTGSATITGGTWNNDGQLYIGYSGTSTGTVNLTGGTVVVGSGGGTVSLAANAGAIGTLNLGTGDSVGTLNVATVTGGSGTATVNFNHTGTYEFAPRLTGKLGANHNGPGTAILTGNNTYSGTTTATAGLFQIDANSRLGTSTLTLNGGGIRYGAAFDDLRAFTLGANGGTLDTNGFGVSHTPAISGTGRLTKAGTGTLSLTGGTSYSGGTIIKSGTLAVTTAGSINHASGDLVVGASSGDSGALNLAGGTISNDSGWLGYESGSNGSATVTGGTWSNSSSLSVGRYGTGTLDLNGGTVSVNLGNGTVRLADQAGSTGTLNLGTGDTAGTLAAAAIEGGSGTATVNFNHAASSYTFSSPLTGTLSVNQTGPGITILTGCNIHTGATTVSSGTLILASSSVSNIVVHSGSTLGGEGTTAGSLAFTAGPSTLLFDPATQAGALTAATADVTGALVLVKPTGATAIGTTYTILKLTAGTFSGNPTDHFVAGPRETLAFANGNTELTLTPTIASLTWQGNTANPSFWDVTTTANWDNHGPDQFYPNDDVTFDDTASSFAVAVQGAAVTPGHIVFANSANAYSVSGGGIDGGPLTKTGTSTVTILSALSNTGGITVADGVLNLAGGNSHTGVTTVHSGTLAVTASGSINDASANMIVGKSSGDNGALNVSGGTVSDAYAFLGYDTGSTGNATITSGTWTHTGGFYVGLSGTGGLDLNNGNVSDQYGFLGFNPNAKGSATISGGAWSNAISLYVGIWGTGTLNLDGGTISDVSGYLGYESGSNGSATVTGGDWSNSSSLFVGRNGTGTLDLNGGTVSVDLGNGTVRLAVQAGSTGTLNLGTGDTAGTLAAAVIEGGSGTATVNFNHAASSYTFSPMLTGTLSVNHSGTGTTILTGSNTYTGATTVSSGTLNITGSSASNITVYPDAALGGEGTTSGSLTFTAGPSTLRFDPVTQAGALTAATADVTGALVLVKPTGATAIGTTYTVLKLTAGTFNGNPTDHFVTDCRATLAFANGNTELTLTPTIASLTWQGNTANPSFWDVATTANWENHGPDRFYPNDDVTFDDTASSFAVAVQGAVVTPGHIVFANSANAYSVSGGGIGGGSLTKNGTHTVTIHSSLSNTGGITVADGVLILAAPNTFTGGIAISGGELRFGARERLNPDANALTLGSGTIIYDGISPMTHDTMQVNLTGGGSELRTDTAPSITWRIGGRITGSGNWSKSGAGVLALGRNTDAAPYNNFTGPLTVTAGGLEIRHATSLGVITSGTFIQSATLLMQNFGQTSGSTIQVNEPLDFSGTSNFSVLNRENKIFTDKFAGPVNVSGTLNISSGITTGAQVPGFEINGPVATSSGATLAFGVQGGYPVPLIHTAQAIKIGGVIKGSASVTVQGGSGSVFTLSLPGYSGNTTVQSGRLKLEAANANNESSTIVIAPSGATLDLSFAGTDTVDKLFIGGVQQNAGVYEAIGNTGTGNEIAQITGNGTLTVTSGPAYQMWIDIFTTIPAGDRDPDDDPDGDGKSNLLEFATDDDPSSPLASGKVAGKVVDQMLTLTLPVRGTMAATTFSGTTDQVSVPVDGITYRIQGARDLAFGGANASVVSELVPALVADMPPLSDPGWEYRTFRTAGTSVSQSADFLRAVIEAAP